MLIVPRASTCKHSVVTGHCWHAVVRFIALALLMVMTGATGAAETGTEVPLVIGHRTIHVFRTTLGAFSPVERADGARHRIETAFQASAEGWTSVRSTGDGLVVELDGQPMFLVVAGDARKLAGESLEELANSASRALQKAWREARERRDPRATTVAALKVVAAAFALIAALAILLRFSQALRQGVTARLSARLNTFSATGLGSKLAALLLAITSRFFVLLAWILALFVVFVFFAFSLEQFVHTRAIGESLAHSLGSLLTQNLIAAAKAIPGVFIAITIFLAAWIATQLSTELFSHVASGRLKLGMLDTHTAPATRRITNAALWLFALAMAYPYLPGAQTEAFKGLSVILGLMVSIGASGLVGQVASGMILVYTRALLLGEYVRIQDCEGTVTELGLFVTRLRTGHGEEVSLPNALVLANVTRNYSRVTKGNGFMLDTTVTIGYDTPWRQVHAMLLEAAATLAEIAREPAPHVMQTALSDFYVAYKLVVYVDAASPSTRARITSDLHAAIQDVFNRYEVQIMSPHYEQDPDKPKTVPAARWHASPAARPPQ